MRLNNILKIAILAVTCLTGLRSVSIAADFTGSVEIGASQVSTDNSSSKFTEYRGFNYGDGVYPVTDIDLSYNDKSYYLDFIGKDLGQDTRGLLLESGKYGRYRVFLDYDQTLKFISNDSRTIFSGAGGAKLTLPALYNENNLPNNATNGGQTTVAALMTELNAKGGGLNNVDLKLLRKDTTAGFSMTSFREVVDFNLTFKREQKEGIKSIGTVVQGTTEGQGGVRNSIILPEPVDYVTDILKASVAYTREKAQLELEYYLSVFNNDKESLMWTNPYKYGALNPVISLPPDNRYQRWTLSGGYNLPYNTRVSLVAEYGKMSQDQDLLPYHSDPAALATYGNPPRSSAQAEIETRLLNVNVSSRPASKLGVTAKYRHYETVNNTPIGTFTYATDDGMSPTGTYISATNKDRRNQPFDYIQDKGTIDFTYRILQKTNLTVGYDQDVMHRDERERDRTTEDSYKAGVKTNLTGISLGGNYLNGKRRGDIYNGFAILDSHPDTPTTTTLLGTSYVPNWVNHPDLRKMDIADRDREKYGAFLSIFPADNTTIGISFAKVKDGFPNTEGFTDYDATTVGFLESQLGIKENNTETVTIDISTAVTEEVTLFTYITNDNGRSKEVGRVMGNATTLAQTQRWDNATYNWTSEIMDKNDVMGLGANITLMKGKVTITPDYTYARSTTSIGIAGGSYFDNLTPSTTITPIPDLHTERHTFNLNGNYKLTKNVTVGANYLYESYTSDDWATDGMTLDDVATLSKDKPLVPLSGSVSDYVANVGTITLAYKW